MAGRGRTRSLGPDEAALWRRVEQSVTPLHPERRAPAPTAPATDSAAQPEAETAKLDLSGFEIGGRVLPTRPAATARQPVRMDAKAFGRMRRGKLPVEGRIDLHGLTLAEAHPRLIGFVLSSFEANRRLVLVITGKGRGEAAGWADPARRGVLREQVPHWLRSGPLAAIVMQIAPAHRSHGGEGAFYVYLRRGR